MEYPIKKRDYDCEYDNNEKLFSNQSLDERSKPGSITNSRIAYSYSTTSSRRSKQDRVSVLNTSALSKITTNIKTKLLPTVREDGYIKRSYSENHVGSNDTTILSSEIRAEFMDSRKIQNEALITGIRKFNLRPKQGIDYFIENGFISERTPKAIAEFLYEESQDTEDKKNEHWKLDKKNMGLYLGDNDEFNVQVLDEFVKLHNFEGQSYDDALRTFLEEFFLPGESQIIDRMMQKFAYHYYNQNQTVFSCPDTAYILAFSIILLNTDLHNSRVKKKMTKEEFIKNNQGIDNGKDLPLDYLSYIYDNISQKEIKSKTGEIEMDTTKSITKILNDISYSFTNSNMEGWLYKRGGIGKKQWKKKWCVVANSCMYFFHTKNKDKTIGILPLCDLTVSKYEFDNNKIFKNFTKTRYYFIIKAKPKNEKELLKQVSSDNPTERRSIPNFAVTDNTQKVLYSKHVNGKVIADIQDYYIFGVDTKEECEYWISIIESQIHDSMAAYRSLAAVKRHSIIQKKDINELTDSISSSDILHRTTSEMSSATRIVKDNNYLYNMESMSNIRSHNANSKTLINDKDKGNLNLSTFLIKSPKNQNSTITNSTDQTYENISDVNSESSIIRRINSFKLADDDMPNRLSLEFSEIDFSPLKYSEQEEKEADDINSVFEKIELSPTSPFMSEKYDLFSNNRLKDFKSFLFDDHKEDKSTTFRENLFISNEFQKLCTGTDLLSPIGISYSPDDSNSTISSTSKQERINIDKLYNEILNNKINNNSFSIPSFSIDIDTIHSGNKGNIQQETKKEEVKEEGMSDSFSTGRPYPYHPNYIYGSSTESIENEHTMKSNHTVKSNLRNKSSCLDMNDSESLEMMDSTIKEFNESDDDNIPNLSSLEFSVFEVMPVEEEKSFEEIEFDECNTFFEDQSQIPKTDMSETKLSSNEGDSVKNVLTGSEFSDILK